MLNRVLQSWIVSVLGLLMLVFFVYSIMQQRNVTSELDKAILNLSGKIDELQGGQEAAIQLGDFARTDTYIERQVRQHLNYKKPDEHMVIVYRNNEEDSDFQIEEISQDSDPSNLSLWWRFVTGQ